MAQIDVPEEEMPLEDSEHPVIETLTSVLPIEVIENIKVESAVTKSKRKVKSTNGVTKKKRNPKLKEEENDINTDFGESSEVYNPDDESGEIKSTQAKPKKEVKTKESRCYLQQRSYIQQACLEGSKSSGDIHRMLKSIYGEKAISRAQAHNWFKMFKGGRTMVQDSARSGRPPTSRTDAKMAQMKQLVKENRRISIRNLAALQGISFGSVYEIISKDLKLRRVADQFVPQSLPEDQREYRLAMCKDLLSRYEVDQLLISKTVVGAETCVFCIPNKKYLEANTEAKPFYVKAMLIFFFDINGLIHHEFVPPESTPIDQSYYLSVLLRLYQSMFQKRSERWNSWDWFLLHEYNWVHNSFPVLEYLTKNNITAMPVAPNSPDLSPFDAILYQKLKYHFAGKLFNTTESIQEHTEKVLNQISWKDFQKCFKQWPDLWRNCIKAGGDYFEKDTTGSKLVEPEPEVNGGSSISELKT